MKRKKMFYGTWQRASEEALKIEDIKTINDYRKLYKENDRLPSNPDKFYEDFPSWIVFLGGKRKFFYPTWEEASVALQKIKGIQNQISYRKLYKEDERLPSNPDLVYRDFPSWTTFLGK
ncbi:MAG: integrase repeat-containing protein [Patescibacteria group bacterium]